MVVEEKNSGSGSATTAASAISLQTSASSVVQDDVKAVSYSASSAGHESESLSG